MPSGRRRPRSVAHLMDTVWSIIKLKAAAKAVTGGRASWATAGACMERRTRASSLTIDSTNSRPAALTACAARLAIDRSQAKRTRGPQKGFRQRAGEHMAGANNDLIHIQIFPLPSTLDST